MAPTQRRRPKGRPRLPGGNGRKLKTNTVSSFTASHKLDVLNHLNSYDSIELTINTFYPQLPEARYNSRRTLILDWRRNRSKIEQICTDRGGMDKKKDRKKGVATLLPRHEELGLVRWINDLRDEGVPVTPTMLRLQALDVAKAAVVPSFKASWCWQNSFKARHKFSLRSKTRQGQICPAELDQIAADFVIKVKQKAAEIGATRIYNADQTAVFFEYLPTKTLATTGSKTVWVKCGGKSKDRATLMLLGDSTGLKYPPFVVFKMRSSTVEETREENLAERHGFSRTMWAKQIRKIQNQTGMQVYTNPKGWWNRQLTIHFLKFHFGDRQELSEPILLLLEDFSGHWTDDVVEYAKEINVTLLEIPPNATSVCQPADATWNGPLKVRLRNIWIRSLREQLRSRQPGTAFKLKAPDRFELCSWIYSTWIEVAESTISAGFRKCGLIDNNGQDEDVQASNTGAHENADDIADELQRAGFLDRNVGIFSLDDDFDKHS